MKDLLFICCVLLSAFFFENESDCQVTSHSSVENDIDNRSKSEDSLTSDSISDSPVGFNIPVIKTGSILKVGINDVTISWSNLSGNSINLTSVGICWDTKPHPKVIHNRIVEKTDSGKFITNIHNLMPRTTYFIRTYAITGSDSVYGQEKAFFTHKQEAVADVDGNYYNIVNIGSQTWLAEDLKTTRFNDSTLIPRVADSYQWARLTTPAYCWYANDSVNYSFPRGKLYNWFTVNTGKLCPAGWHVPSDQDWIALSTFLGGDSIAGGKLKTQGTVFWRSPNQDATNQSGFSAFPGGYRNPVGRYFYATIFDNWWSSSAVPPEAATYWYVYHARGILYHEISFRMLGYSVRCIRD
jgi:uncharacterized protein (TIGR02145 family)